MLHDYSLEYQGHTGRKTEKVAPIKAQEIERNLKRFPDDFMFQFTDEEFRNLRSQIMTSSWGGFRYRPMVDTKGTPGNAKEWLMDYIDQIQNHGVTPGKNTCLPCRQGVKSKLMMPKTKTTNDTWFEVLTNSSSYSFKEFEFTRIF